MESTQFYCDNCGKSKKVKILHLKNHNPYKNGLRLQTTLHRCSDATLKVINLHVDEDGATRSYETLYLPKIEEPKTKIISNLPIPSKIKSKINKDKLILLTNIPPYEGFKIILHDFVTKVKINIGNVKTEELKFVIQSSLNTIRLEYYESNISPNENTKEWLNEFINLIERLPPTNLGQIIEGLKYIQQLCTEKITEEDIKVLSLIINSPSVRFEIIKEFDPADLLGLDGLPEYGAKTVTKLIELMSDIEQNQNKSLQEFTITHFSDLIYLIQLFLILEKAGFIHIERPDEIFN